MDNVRPRAGWIPIGLMWGKVTRICLFHEKSLKLRANAELFLERALCDGCQKTQNGNASGNEVSSSGSLKLLLIILVLEVSISRDPSGEFGSLKHPGSGETS